MCVVVQKMSSGDQKQSYGSGYHHPALSFDAPVRAPPPAKIVIGGPLSLSVHTSKQLQNQTASLGGSAFDTAAAPPPPPVINTTASTAGSVSTATGSSSGGVTGSGSGSGGSGGSSVSSLPIAKSSNELRIKPVAKRACDALQQICLQYLSHRLVSVDQLDALNDDLAISLLYLIWSRGDLVPRTARLFLACRHEAITTFLSATIDVDAALKIPNFGTPYPYPYPYPYPCALHRLLPLNTDRCIGWSVAGCRGSVI